MSVGGFSENITSPPELSGWGSDTHRLQPAARDVAPAEDAGVAASRGIARRSEAAAQAGVAATRGASRQPQAGGDVWLCLAGFSRAPAAGSPLRFGPDLDAVYLGAASGALHRVRFEPKGGVTLREAIERCGSVPLPPYITRNGGAHAQAEEDRERYQTVFASREGAVAAPTAGLHFTVPLLERLIASGIGTARVTLHVGPATFLPVRTNRIEDHPMPAERYEVPAETARAVAETRSRGGRVVAVGTTVVRALESASDGRGGALPARGRTDLYILPGHRFRVVDALVTNFHLPRSTLLAMVCAFAGRERVLGAYRHAIEAGYRFYSYGDAMLIL